MDPDYPSPIFTQTASTASHSIQKKIMKYHRRIRRQISKLSREGRLSKKYSMSLKRRFQPNKFQRTNMTREEQQNGEELRRQVAKSMIRRLSFSETDSQDFIKNLRTEDFGIAGTTFGFEESDSSNQVSECDENLLHQFPQSASMFRPEPSSFQRESQQRKEWRVDDQVVKKVIKRARSWDVVVQVVDARNPQETRLKGLKTLLEKQGFRGHMCLVINKTDLVPQHIVDQWKRHLRRETTVFTFKQESRSQNSIISEEEERANETNKLVDFLKQKHIENVEEKQKSKLKVGFLGMPNCGKSTMINRLFGRKVCGVSPRPGHTRAIVEKYLLRNLIVVDTPGIFDDNFETMFSPVPLQQIKEAPLKEGSNSFENADLNSSARMQNPFVSATHFEKKGELSRSVSLVLNNAISLEHVPNLLVPVEYIIKFVSREYLQSTYQIKSFKSTEDFLRKLALQRNIFSMNGQIDIQLVARFMISEWNRGRIPHFTTPDQSYLNGRFN